MRHESEQVDDSGSVTRWISDLKQGDSGAAQALWNRYVHQMIAIAARRMGHTSRRVTDEDDVVSQAFARFLMGVQENRFSQLEDRDDLWQVLVMFISRAATDTIRLAHAQKRGGGLVRGDSAFLLEESEDAGISAIHDTSPSPDIVSESSEQVSKMLALLERYSPVLREVALLRLEGQTNKEIGEILGKSLPTIERKLKLIREIWREDLQKGVEQPR